MVITAVGHCQHTLPWTSAVAELLSVPFVTPELPRHSALIWELILLLRIMKKIALYLFFSPADKCSVTEEKVH